MKKLKVVVLFTLLLAGPVSAEVAGYFDQEFVAAFIKVRDVAKAQPLGTIDLQIDTTSPNSYGAQYKRTNCTGSKCQSQTLIVYTWNRDIPDTFGVRYYYDHGADGSVEKVGNNNGPRYKFDPANENDRKKFKAAVLEIAAQLQ